MESRRINDEMPRHALRLATDGLRVSGRSVKRSRFTVLGITYRPNVKETRFAPSIELVNLIKKRGGRICIYDPMFTPEELKRMGYHAEPTLAGALEKADCAIITVAHEEFKSIKAVDLGGNMSKNAVIVDCAGIIEPAQIEKVGLIYRGVGRGLWSK
jgi:UDP-N-acetyl-D-mannosaminuronate dehydrogenase